MPLWERVPTWAFFVVGSVVILGLAIGLPTYLSQRHHAPSSSAPASAGKPATAALIGKPAPGFSLQDVNGQSYTLTPGDGKAHLLVFYMGYF